MATVTKENIGLLNEKITLTLETSDYLPAFEKSVKEYSKKANLPGFRKGMVPASLIKKMYGASLFTDEVLRTVDRELIHYLETEKLNIFGQPLPLEMDIRQLDMNQPVNYTFQFEIGCKPEFSLPDFSKISLTRYKVKVTEEMVQEEITRLQNRYGNMTEPETVTTEENVLNVLFTESDAQGNEINGGIKKENSLLVKYFSENFRNKWMGRKKEDSELVQLMNAFDDKERAWILNDLGMNTEDVAMAEKFFKITITKVGLLEKRELTEDFFSQLYPSGEIKTETDFRNKIKEEIQAHWNRQASLQLQHMVYHELLNHTILDLPESFLKKWMKSSGEKAKSDDEVEKEFPVFINQLKWTLISEKIIKENNIQVTPDELRHFARQQLFEYMGVPAGGEDQPWVHSYVEKMMSDRNYVEDAFHRIQTQKTIEWAASQVSATEQETSLEDFLKIQQEHQHH